MDKIKIVGAGLAGLSAASILTRSGVNVDVFEKRKNIFNDGLNDFQVIRNYGGDKGFFDSLKKYGFVLPKRNLIYKIIKHPPKGKPMEIFGKDPLFYVVERGGTKNSLDSIIYESIDKNLVDFKMGQGVETSFGDIIAVGPFMKNVQVFGCSLRGVDVDKSTIHFFSDAKYFPKGYFYSSPFDKDLISVAAVSFDMDLNLSSAFKKFISENKIVKELVKGHTEIKYFSGGGLCNFPNTARVNNKLFVGAAAGFVEASRGFGIKYSILSGIAAANSIIKSENYDYIWKNFFGEELRSSLKRNLFLTSLTDEEYSNLFIGRSVPVENYSKPLSDLSKGKSKQDFSEDLKNWREKYNIEKYFIG